MTGPPADETPEEACHRFDQSIGVTDREYDSKPTSYPRISVGLGHGAYDVFSADASDSEAVPPVHDGQDQATIEEVMRLCDPVATVLFGPAAADDY